MQLSSRENALSFERRSCGLHGRSNSGSNSKDYPVFAGWWADLPSTVSTSSLLLRFHLLASQHVARVGIDDLECDDVRGPEPGDRARPAWLSDPAVYSISRATSRVTSLFVRRTAHQPQCPLRAFVGGGYSGRATVRAGWPAACFLSASVKHRVSGRVVEVCDQDSASRSAKTVASAENRRRPCRRRRSRAWPERARPFSCDGGYR